MTTRTQQPPAGTTAADVADVLFPSTRTQPTTPATSTVTPQTSDADLLFPSSARPPRAAASAPEQPSAADGLFPSTAPPAPAPAPAAPAVPEAYTFTLPEADAVYMPEGLREHLRAVATASGWTQEDLDGEVAARVADTKAQHAALTRELYENPEIGGTKLASAEQAAQRALNSALPPGSPERQRFDRDLAAHGLSNYPPLKLLLARLGRQVT